MVCADVALVSAVQGRRPRSHRFVVGDEMIVTWDEKHENHQQEGEEEVIQSGFWFRTLRWFLTLIF